MSKRERDFDTFMQLKQNALQGITEENAAKRLKNCQIQVLKAWETLNAEHITAVEDFYLNVAEFFHVETYVAASQKANTDGIKFDDALFSIGTDDLLMRLNACFKEKLTAEKRAKIQTIDELYAPAKQAWAGLHARLYALVQYQQQCQRYFDVGNALKTPLTTYLSYLEAELNMHGVPLPIPIKSQQAYTQMIGKMINRYNVIASLNRHFNHKTDFNKEDIQFAKKGLRICFQNEPGWFERPFLQQLLDVLSFGIMALYRTFFSVERKLKDDIEEPLQLALD